MFDLVSRARRKPSYQAKNVKRFISFSAFSIASLEVPDLWAFFKSFFFLLKRFFRFSNGNFALDATKNKMNNG